MPERKTFSQKIIKNPIWRPIGIVVAMMMGLGIILYIFRNVILTPGFAYGSDVTSFAHTAKYVVDYFRTYHALPPIDMSWYAGFELFHAPLANTYFLGLIYYFVHDISLTTRIFHILSLCIIFLTMFWLVKKEGHPTGNAFLAAILFVNMPMVLMALQSYTKIVSFMFWPLGLYATNKILTTNQNKYVAYLAISIGLITYSHPMMSEVFGLMLGVYALFYAFLDKKIVTRRFFIVWLGVFLGLLLGGKYLIPFVLERAGIVAVSSVEQIFKMGPQWYKDYVIGYGGYLTTFLPIVPLYVVWRRKEPKLTAMYLTALVALIVNVGYDFVHLGSLFPFSQVYFYVWYFAFIFFDAYLLCLLVDFSKIKNLFWYFYKVIAMVLIIYIAFRLANSPAAYIPELQTVIQYEGLAPDIEMAKAIQDIPNPGRVYMSHNPFGFIKWAISLYSDKPNIEGHYYGVARINKEISSMADAIHYQYPDYVFNMLKHLNTRYFVATSMLLKIHVANGENVGKKFFDVIPKYGYKYINKYMYPTNEGEYLFYLDKPSSYLVPITEKTLIIGNYGPTLEMAISKDIPAVTGGSIYFDDYDLDFLKNFDSVVLYGFGFHDRKKAEELAKEYVQSGGHLVVEMFNMQISPLADTPSFLGVATQREKITATAPIVTENEGTPNDIQKLVPKTFVLPGEIQDVSQETLPYVPLTEWNYLSYLGLDQSLVRSPGLDNFSVLGYKNVDGGQVTFVGMNFFYHAFLTHDNNELEFIGSLIGKNNNPSDTGFQSTNEIIQSNKLEFDIQNDQERYVFLSFAYSPHWRAYLDGKEIKIRVLEDLMALKIPAGSHHLEVKYGSTAVMDFSWIITISTLILLLGMIVTSDYFSNKQGRANDKR